MSSKSSSSNTSTPFMTDKEKFRIEKQKQMEQMKLKVQKLREEKMAKHAERVQMLKESQMKKINDSKIEKLSFTNSAPISKNYSRMSCLPQPQKPLHNVLTVNLKDSKAISKTNGEVEKTVNIPAIKKNYSRASCIPQFKVPAQKDAEIVNNKPRQSIVTKNLPPKPKPFLHSNPTSRNVSRQSSIGSVTKNVPKNKISDMKSRPSIAFEIRDTKKPASGHRFSIATANRLAQPKKLPTAQPSSKTIQSRKSVAPLKAHPIADKPALKKIRRSLSSIHFQHINAAPKNGPNVPQLSRARSMGNIKATQGPKQDAVALNKTIVLPVKSESKKVVKFLTPARKSFTPNLFLNTPNPVEMRKRLNDWLQRRGKSLSQFSHLHCFGVHEALKKQALIKTTPEEENKENAELSENDDDSVNENITGKVRNMAEGWRETHAEEADFLENNVENEPVEEDHGNAKETEVNGNLDHIMKDALNDLRQLILEGYSWHQCEEWLRTIVKNCSGDITNQAAYWECRAALEEKRGDFSEAVECYNKAIQQGALPSSVDTSLDHLLDKFMKLNLNPHSENKPVKQPNKNLLDVKNVFKSTLIKFAIQQKQSSQTQDEIDNNAKKFTATPVRRSTRLTMHNTNYEKTRLIQFSSNTVDCTISTDETKEVDELGVKSSARKHLVQICSTLTNIETNSKQALVFVPNKALHFE